MLVTMNNNGVKFFDANVPVNVRSNRHPVYIPTHQDFNKSMMILC